MATEISEKQKRKFIAAAELVDKGDMAVLEKILEFQDFLEDWQEKLDVVFAEFKGLLPSEIGTKFNDLSSSAEEILAKVPEAVSKAENLLAELQKSRFDDSKTLETLNDSMKKCMERIEQVKNMIPEMPEKTDLTDIYNRLMEIENKKPVIPEEVTGEKIVEKINDLPTDEDKYLIDIEHIDGLENRLKKLERGKSNQGTQINAGIIGRDLIKAIDISSQLNGVTKTFNIQSVWNVFAVNLSSYPYGSLRYGIDFTWTPTSITFTSEIDAATQLAEGQKCILLVVQS